MTSIQKLTLSEMDQLCPPVIMHLEHWHSPEEAQQAPVKASFCCLHPFRVSDHSSSWMVEKGSHLLETLSFFFLPENGSLLSSLPLPVNFLFLFLFFFCSCASYSTNKEITIVDSSSASQSYISFPQIIGLIVSERYRQAKRPLCIFRTGSLSWVTPDPPAPVSCDWSKAEYWFSSSPVATKPINWGGDCTEIA